MNMVNSIARSRARSWADRAVRSYAATALSSSGHADVAKRLRDLPTLDTDAALDSADREMGRAFLELLEDAQHPESERAVLTAVAARAILAIARAVQPSPVQLQSAIDALHIQASAVG